MKNILVFGHKREIIYGALYTGRKKILGKFFGNFILCNYKFFEYENRETSVETTHWYHFILILTTFDGNYYSVINETFDFEYE